MSILPQSAYHFSIEFTSMLFPTAALEMSEKNLCQIFRDVDNIDWPLIGSKLHLAQFNGKCLRQTLKQWHKNTKGDPWIIWRKLAVVVASVYDSKAGQELRQQAGVGV